MQNEGTVGLPRLMERVKTKEGVYPKLLVLDPIGDFIDGPEEDNSLVKPLMLHFRRLAIRYQCTILLVGHTPKQKIKGEGDDAIASISPRGAGAWKDNSRFGYGLYRPEEKVTTKFLSEIGEENTAANRSRVVFGGKLKENQGGSLHGTQKFCQHEKSGLLIDMTSKISW